MRIANVLLVSRASWRFIAICLSVATAVLTFIQIERGTGDKAQVLLFTGFDLLLAVAISLTFLSLTRRCWASFSAGFSTVLIIYLSSKLKLHYTLMPAQASDLLMLYSSWPAVKFFSLPMITLAALVVAILAMCFNREKPISLALRSRLSLLGLAGGVFVSCAFIDDQLSDDDGRLVAGQWGPKIAVFYRSIYRWPVLHTPPIAEHYEKIAPEIYFDGNVKPNIVVVLQESTFKPEHLRGQEPVSNFLFDGSAALKVNVRGSGTWVEEYSVLHGVPPPLYGEHYMLVNILGPSIPLRGTSLQSSRVKDMTRPRCIPR